MIVSVAPGLAEHAALISFSVVIVFTTYLSVIIGELVPKRIALAARNVCGEPVMGSKEEIDAIRACRRQATTMAMAQVPVSLASND